MSITHKNITALGHTVPHNRNVANHYVPDLSAFMSLCDANYAKFMKLLPDFYDGNQNKSDTRCFGLSRSEHALGFINIHIIERAKYTTTLNIEQGATEKLIPATSMQVRLYHDASMAEVMSYQGIDKLKANYSYPNKLMFQKDEKVLCNEFLADWLSYCLKFGHSFEDMPSQFQLTQRNRVGIENFLGEKTKYCSNFIKEDDCK